MTNDDYDRLAFAMVSPEQAKLPEYPYVFVTEEGAVHELDDEDRSYLETPFHPGDGARPWIKWQYLARNGWGDLRGFCARSAIPPGIPIIQEPIFREPPKSTIDTIRELASRTGDTVVENPDGTIVVKPAPVMQSAAKKWWQFWR
jgi:hypothetical protein